MTPSTNTTYEFGFNNNNPAEDEFLIIEFMVKTDSKEVNAWQVSEKQESELCDALDDLGLTWHYLDATVFEITWDDSREELIKLLEGTNIIVYREAITQGISI